MSEEWLPWHYRVWVNDQLAKVGIQTPREPLNMLTSAVVKGATTVALLNRVQPDAKILIVDHRESWELVQLDRGPYGSGPFLYSLPRGEYIGISHALGALVFVRPESTAGLVEDSLEGRHWT